MAAEGVENFQAIILSCAAIAGSAIAAFGLWTWKQQIRWQHGRGLAISTLQAFFEFKKVALDVKGEGFFPLEEDSLEVAHVEHAKSCWDRSKSYCERLTTAQKGIDTNIAEAMIVWDDDFSDFMGIVISIEHIARSTVLTGAASIDPRSSVHQRRQSLSLHSAFHSDVYGYNEEKQSLSDLLAKAQTALMEILKTKRLS